MQGRCALKGGGGGGGEGSYITSELSRSILMGVGIILVWAGVKIIELVCTLHRVA